MLESTANFISVSERSRRSIASPIPCVAFIPANDQERQWLDATEGILEQNQLKDIPTAASAVPFTAEIATGLIDRLDGVALLVEALAHEHPTGQLHEHFRVLERPFSRPARLLAAPLLDFSTPAEQPARRAKACYGARVPLVRRSFVPFILFLGRGVRRRMADGSDCSRMTRS